MYTTLLISGIILLAGLCLFLGSRLCRSRKFMSTNCRIAEHILKNIDAYIILVDSEFNVLKTNYYSISRTEEQTTLPKVGNLLRCKNGTDAKECGKHELCTTCPVRQSIGKAFAQKKGFSKLEVPMTLYTSDKNTDCVDCIVSVSGNFLDIDDKGQLLLTVHDITDQKDIQRELTESRLHAEEADRMKSQFLANTSHELRTPLNAIVGFSELLAGDSTPEEKQEYAQIIRANNELLLQLVNDILDLSKIEAGTLEFLMTDVDLNAVMEELEGVYCRKQQNKQVKIRFERKYPTCHVRADRSRLAQVVSNFLSNAVKFTQEGEIVFGYEIRDKEFYCYVKDSGIGIPEEKLTKIFKRFVKIGSHKQGVGIGLAICKSIVESVGGQIGAESEIEKGSTFWFTFPGEPLP